MRKPIHQPLGKGLRIYFWLAFGLSTTHLAAQQCPRILNCPQSTNTYCDESSNDLSLWNNPPFTYSPTMGDSNLYEGAIDLNIRVKGCSGGGITSISYILYLDLNSDDEQETVITSSNPPPSGCVRVNNQYNPGFSGGDTVLFDQRALPDSMLYRFSFEIDYSGDTTTGWVRFSSDHAPYDFIPVILPEGRHRIEWRIVQDGVERFCDRNFKVRDCKTPLVTCKTNAPIYLDASLTAFLPLSEAYNLKSDNITPDSQLLVGMRRVGTGSGFPLNGMGEPQDTALFNCSMNENQYVEVWVQDRVGNTEHCTTLVLVYDTAGICTFIPPPPPPNPVSVCARTFWNNDLIQNVAFSTAWTVPGSPPASNPLPLKTGGCAELSSLPPTTAFTLSAQKDVFLLNGVTTYDLVLISKHILGIQPFDAGWKMSAADANRSGSVTTFDIVELRKLILGLSVKLPNNTPSWRMYVDTCIVVNSPFIGTCPSDYTLPVLPLGAYPSQISFKGLKVGDVNGSATGGDSLQGAAVVRGIAAGLELPDTTLQAGETMEIPLSATEGGEWTGLQFSLEFDPSNLDIELVQVPEALQLKPENWAKPLEGVLNLSWSDGIATTVLPGDALMRVRVNAKADLKLSEVLKLSEKPRILPEVYDADGNNHPLQLVFSQKATPTEKGKVQIFSPMPNPSTGSAHLPLRLDAAETVSMELTDLAGRTFYRMVSKLESGAHLLEIPATAMPLSGVYIWRVIAGTASQSGRLVRL